jgi:glycosyltransferase involved in cell wall biosynthesis
MSRAAKLARSDRLDIFWSTFSILPPRMPPGTLRVVTVYDLVWLRLPATMTTYNLCVQRTLAATAIERADVVIAISRSTAEDLVQSLRVPVEKIRLVYPGISEACQPRDPAQAAEYISVKYKTPLRYLAAAGTIEPRKNLKLLVRVLCILKGSGQLDCPLLIAGAKGWKSSALFREIHAAGLTENEIRFLGYLPDEDLPLFYTGAQLFLFPSLHEGFGLPPLEAMACGTPVIASNARCMPEVLGNAAIFESPANAEGFAKAVAEVLSNQSLRAVLRARGLERAREYRWETSVEQLLQSFGISIPRMDTVQHAAPRQLTAQSERPAPGQF